MHKPLVSICIPTYNGETFIRQAIESALQQTYRPLEIIVSDDASTDNTLAIITGLLAEKTDIPITVFHHTPCGIGANWNYSIAQAKGEFIKFLFQDDLLKPECIKSMMDLLETDQEIGMVFCKREILIEGDHGKHKDWLAQYKDLQSGWTTIAPIQHGRALLKDIKFLSHPNNKVGEPTVVLLRKSVFDKIGYFNTDLKQALDYEFWYRVFKHFKVGYLNAELAAFRLHEHQATAKNNKTAISDYQDYPKLVYKHLFWCLHRSLKKELFLEYNFLGRFLKKLTHQG